MKYMLLIYVDEAAFAKAPKDQIEKVTGAYAAWTEEMRKAGVFAAADRLQPSATASTVRSQAGGKSRVLDGPYAEVKEQLGGFYILEVADKKAALDWAAKCPSIAAGHGSVEVRPVWAM